MTPGAKAYEFPVAVRLLSGRRTVASVAGKADLEVAKQQRVKQGEFYALLFPRDDIHYVSTISAEDSVSIHLLANDTACVVRHKFEPAAGTVTSFRSGYSNAPCPPEPQPA